MNKIPVLIDLDTGIDDAMALVVACASEKLDIRGITTVAGNVDLVHTTRNTLNVLDLLGRKDIKVARGVDKPLERDLYKASFVHGTNGLRGYDFAENVDYALQEESAIEFMKNILLASEEKITLLPLGPLSNIAHLFIKYPEVKEKVEKIVFMGTSHNVGNPTPITTFNVRVDPEAFDIVVNSGIPFYGVSLNATQKGYISEYEKMYIRDSLTGPAANLVKGILFNYGTSMTKEQVEKERENISTENEESIPTMARLSKLKRYTELHDPVTVAFVTNPELFSYKKYYCTVVKEGEMTTGYTYIDINDYYCKTEEEKNFYFVDGIDREGFIDVFMKSIEAFQ